MTIDEKIAAIRAGLDGVTPGPWAWESHGRDDTFGVGVLVDENDQPQSGWQHSGMMVVADPVAIEVARAPDAAHIARLDPDTVRTILDRLAAAEAENKRLRGALEPFALVAEHDIGDSETDGELFRPMPSRLARALPITVGHLRRAQDALGEK